MQIGVPVEMTAGETRVAVTPETAKKLKGQGHTVCVASGAGTLANATDDAYVAAGAQITDQGVALGCELVLKVRAPQETELARLTRGAILVGMLDPFDSLGVERLANAGVTSFALEAAPRSTRAQGLDVLSSQANIAGYKAVLVAAHLYPRFLPMLMTAAGTVKAARVLVLGAGVAGLQAIATAKRLGGVIEASDVRPAAKEQVESLGAKFIHVPFETQEEREAAEGVGGYARPMPSSWLARQALTVHERAKAADIIISTALIPGLDAPTLIDVETVQGMRPGSVIVDLAAGRGAELLGQPGVRGGNCPLSEPDRIVTKHGITIAGYTNLAAMVGADASSLYSRNVLDFLKLIITKEGVVNIDLSDDIVAATLLTRDGVVTQKKK